VTTKGEPANREPQQNVSYAQAWDTFRVRGPSAAPPGVYDFVEAQKPTSSVATSRYMPRFRTKQSLECPFKV